MCVLKHYNSTDVLSDMRVNVLQEGSEKILWYKVVGSTFWSSTFLTHDA